MASALPIISTTVGAIPELIIDNETGFLIPPEMPDVLARVLIDFLFNNKFNKLMGLKARERAVSFFSREQMVSKYLKLYDSCLNL